METKSKSHRFSCRLLIDIMQEKKMKNISNENTVIYYIEGLTIDYA